MVLKKGKRVAIIYDALDQKGVYKNEEYKAGKSIIHDVRRVQKLLAQRGDKVSRIPIRGNVEAFLKKLIASRVDLVFNLCEGAFNDSRNEMNVCAMLDICGIPYTGCGPLALGVALDKGLTKELLIGRGIPTPKFFVSYADGDCSVPANMNYPMFVKPLREDASLGIDSGAFVRNPSELKRRCRSVVKQYRQPALVEEYIEGRELNISVLGNGNLKPLPISEIDMSRIPKGRVRICDYSAKWVNESEEYANTVPVCPAPLEKKIERRLNEIALSAYRLLGCRGYARVDIRLSPDNIPYVLEVNPNPSIGLDAGIVRSAAAAGLSYEDLIYKIADLALQPN